MAFVSKTTVDKRQVRGITKDVETASPDVSPRAVERAEPQSPSVPATNSNPKAFPTGVVGPIGRFNGFLRCATVIETEEFKDFNDAIVWCGEPEGGITIRKAFNGAPVADKPTIAAPAQPTYVASIAQVGPKQVWAGYGDGMVRAFDIDTRELIFENKKHGGAVTAIAAFEGVVATGAEDFKINLYGADDFRFIISLQGHSNHIVSFAYANGRLYSGSADGTVRCWLPHERSEAANPVFPLVVGKTAIRDIYVQDGFLFTATNSGVSLWSLDDGHAEHTFFAPPNTTVVGTALCAATVTLWVAFSDGNLLVYDLFNFTVAGTIALHNSTIVPFLKLVARSVVSRIFLFTPDHLVSLTSESNSLIKGFEVFPEAMSKLQQRIADHRETIAKNSMELLVKKSQIQSLQRYDKNQRETVVSILGKQRARTVELQYFEQHLDAVQLARNRNKRALAARALEERSLLAVQYRYYVAWVRRLGRTKLHQNGEKARDQLQDHNDQALKAAYLRLSTEALRRARNAARREQVSRVMGIVCDSVVRRHAFTKLRRFVLLRKYARKRETLITALKRHNEDISAHSAWTYLVVGAEYNRTRSLFQAAAEGLLLGSAKVIMRSAFNKLRLLSRRKRLRNRQTILANRLAVYVDTASRRKTIMNWLGVLRANCARKMDSRITSLSNKIDEINSIINDPGILPEKEIDRAITETNKSIGEIQEEIAKLKQRIDDCVIREETLRKELAPPAQDGDAALITAIEELKQVGGIRFRNNASAIAAAAPKSAPTAAAAKKPVSPATTPRKSASLSPRGKSPSRTNAAASPQKDPASLVKAFADAASKIVAPYNVEGEKQNRELWNEEKVTEGGLTEEGAARLTSAIDATTTTLAFFDALIAHNVKLEGEEKTEVPESVSNDLVKNVDWIKELLSFQRKRDLIADDQKQKRESADDEERRKKEAASKPAAKRAPSAPKQARTGTGQGTNATANKKAAEKPDSKKATPKPASKPTSKPTSKPASKPTSRASSAKPAARSEPKPAAKTTAAKATPRTAPKSTPKKTESKKPVRSSSAKREPTPRKATPTKTDAKAASRPASKPASKPAAKKAQAKPASRSTSATRAKPAAKATKD